MPEKFFDAGVINSRKVDSIIEKCNICNQYPCVCEKMEELKKRFPNYQEYLDYIEKNKQTVSEFFNSDTVAKSKYLLIGEYHLKECDNLREQIILNLEMLKSRGFNCIGLELKSDFQEEIDRIDYSNPKEAFLRLKEIIKSPGWTDKNYFILIKAKQLGMKVLLIDKNVSKVESNHPEYFSTQQSRDLHMKEIIDNNIGKADRIIIFIGSDHVHHKIIQSVMVNGEKKYIERIGSLLPKEETLSVRCMTQRANFDNLLNFMSKTPTLEEYNIMSSSNLGVSILPDSGPLKGDSRVSSSDYIITVS